VLAQMHDDIVLHYAAVITPPLRGKTKVRKPLEGMAPEVRDVTWRTFDCAESGNRLFVEGVDEYVSRLLMRRHRSAPRLRRCRPRPIFSE